MIGMSAGFAHAILFIGSWIGAGWAAWRFSKVVEPEVQQIVGSTELAYFISMLAVFVAALIVLIMLTNMLSRSVRAQARWAARPHSGRRFRRPVRLGRSGHRFPVLRLSRPSPAPARGPKPVPFPMIRDGDLRGAPSSAGLPYATATAEHGQRRDSRTRAPSSADVSAGSGTRACRG